MSNLFHDSLYSLTLRQIYINGNNLAFSGQEKCLIFSTGFLFRGELQAIYIQR